MLPHLPLDQHAVAEVALERAAARGSPRWSYGPTRIATGTALGDGDRRRAYSLAPSAAARGGDVHREQMTLHLAL